MPIVSTNDVFNFMGTSPDQRITHETSISSLIDRETSEAKKIVKREIISVAFTDILFNDGLNCKIEKDKLFLRNMYRDIYSITAITEEGTALTAVTDYNDDNDYYLDSKTGILIRNEAYWSIKPFAIKISGLLGYGSLVNSVFQTHPDIKQGIIELVAAKSGLWRVNTETPDGTIETIITTPKKSTLVLLKRNMMVYL